VIADLAFHSMARSNRFVGEACPGLSVVSTTLRVWLEILGGEDLEIIQRRKCGEASTAHVDGGTRGSP
jgi:hypothetical protein